jgi:hypothetical protein
VMPFRKRALPDWAFAAHPPNTAAAAAVCANCLRFKVASWLFP